MCQQVNSARSTPPHLLPLILLQHVACKRGVDVAVPQIHSSSQNAVLHAAQFVTWDTDGQNEGGASCQTTVKPQDLPVF